MKNKPIVNYEEEWTMGNGQCPVCYGNAPDKGWWTQYVGHEKSCSLAKLMKEAGMKPVMKRLNPERSIGWYPDKQGIMITVRCSSNEEEKKKARTYAKEQYKKIFGQWLDELRKEPQSNGSEVIKNGLHG